jgi:ferredoxin
MKAIVDKNLCIGCGLCASDCPEVFVMDDENIAKVIADPVPAEQKEACRLAAQNCPVEAIKITE